MVFQLVVTVASRAEVRKGVSHVLSAAAKMVGPSLLPETPASLGFQVTALTPLSSSLSGCSSCVLLGCFLSSPDLQTSECPRAHYSWHFPLWFSSYIHFLGNPVQFYGFKYHLLTASSHIHVSSLDLNTELQVCTSINLTPPPGCLKGAADLLFWRTLPPRSPPQQTALQFLMAETLESTLTFVSLSASSPPSPPLLFSLSHTPPHRATFKIQWLEY